ncbi:MAG TPA: choice-of-anchor D domain-containing protein [Polyangia bacterium]|jgi:hypothetical protein
MQTKVGVAAASLLMLMLAACADATAPGAPDAGPHPCTLDDDCPAGQSCTQGLCRPNSLVDAAVDQPVRGKMQVDPPVLDFGSPVVGGEYTKAFTIANVGGSPITVTAVNLLEDRTVGAFSVTAPLLPASLDGGASLTVVVVLRPNDENLPTGSIKIHSDDPDPASADATVDLVAHVKGSPRLGVCVLNDAPPPACTVSNDGNPLVDLGTVAYGGSAERVVALVNSGDGNLPVELTEVALTQADHFTLTLFAAVDDPAHPGQKLEQPATLPFLLSAGDAQAVPAVPATELRVHVRFMAVGIDGDLPVQSLVVTYNLPASPTTVPIRGKVSGCRPADADAGVPDGGADPQTDPSNCGTCGHVCVTPHATPACVAGACAVGACAASYADCNGLPGDGCEADLRATVDHCGQCDIACTNGHGATTCQAGVCVPSCDPGYRDCDGTAANGCETRTSDDVANCGACGKTCTQAAGHGTTSCAAGACQPICATGFKDCNGDPADGCEANTTVELQHCGSCTNACTNPHGSTSCNGTACVPVCDSGWGDCNGNPSDGCETELATATWCGACTLDSQCPAGFFCNGAQCEQKRAPGGSCTDGKQCRSTFCADGVCCDTACGGTCQACSAAKKGQGLDGTCGLVVVGSDPDNECADQGAASCGTNGSCDGAGACQRYAPSTVCVAQSCTGTIRNNARLCNGGGTCAPGGTTDCTPYTCNAGGTDCLASCTLGTDCTAGNYCDGAGHCVWKKSLGTVCGGGNECQSGLCVDGVCCDTPCNGACQACTAAKKGAGGDGTCGNIAAGADPDNECLTQAQSTCGTTGVCGGNGACQLYPASTQCAAQTCSGSTRSAARQCDGTGTCGVGGTSSCAPYNCNAGGTDCLASCSQHSECTAGNYCDPTNHCVPKKGDGGSCGGAAECTSGFCFDSVCCHTDCTGICRTCNGTNPGTCQNTAAQLDPRAQCGACQACDGNGGCTAASAGTDPHNECAYSAPATCGDDGTCNGAGACRKWPSSTVCVAQSCVDGTPSMQYNADTCNGSGTCTDGGSVSCGGFKCNGTACYTSCTDDTRCNTGAGYTCVSGQCRRWTTLMSQNFTTCPTDWTLLNQSYRTPARNPWFCDSVDANPTGSTSGTGYAIADSDSYGPGVRTGLMTPVFDFSQHVNVRVSFWHTFKYLGPSDYGQLQYSTNGTAGPFTTLATYNFNHTAIQELMNLDTTTVAGHANVVFRFWYDDGNTWAWWWAVDDVLVEAR